VVLAGGILWYLVVQPRGQTADQTSTRAEIKQSPKLPPSAPPLVRQQAEPFSPLAAPATPQPQPQAQPVPSMPLATKQAGAPASTAPTAQLAPVAHEPKMTALRGGSFEMGSNDDVSEKPVHQVTVKPFELSTYPITVREWNECASAKACSFAATGNDDAPITNVSWNDAKQFVAWLAGVLQKSYRLPSEAEWEYAARGGTQKKYWWGDQFQPGMAACKNCGDAAGAEEPLKVGSFKPNPFGLYDMGGGVDQWVEDCWHKTYQGAPSDGSPWVGGDCTSRVIRSGSWRNDTTYVRPSNRDHYDISVRYPTHGFRVALSP
jgi:formylglycine-generating enzyme required for sulfatase activity